MCCSWQKNMGFEAKSVLNHQVGVIEIGEGEETIGILSHVDVVPPENPQSWISPPFEMTERNGHLWGRGNHGRQRRDHRLSLCDEVPL